MNKTFKIVIAIIAVLITGWLIADYINQPVQQETALEHAEKHLDPQYVCPMHPQIIKGEEGACPICGMDLVPVAVEQPDVKKEKKFFTGWLPWILIIVVMSQASHPWVWI